MGMGECHRGAFEFGSRTQPIEIPGCGTFLFLGGHPVALECQERADPLAVCVDLVPPREAWDIGLVASPAAESFLEVRDDVQHVLSIDGRSIVINALAFPGNSGGPVLDKEGRAVGVAYTRIQDIHSQNVPMDPSLEDHLTVAVLVDSEMKALIDAELAAVRAGR